MKAQHFEKTTNPGTDSANADIFYVEPGSSKRPSHNFVVARDDEGNVLSRYGDDVWDYTHYSVSIRPNPIFRFEDIPNRFRDEVKWLFFCLDRVCEGGLAGAYSIGSLMKFLGLLRSIAKFCQENNLEYKAWFKSERHMMAFLRHKATKIQHDSLSALYVALAPVKDYVGLEFVISKKVRVRIAEIRQERKLARNQHPVIPSRILFGIVKYSADALEKYNSISEHFEAMYKELPTSSGYATHYETWLMSFVQKYCERVNDHSLSHYLEDCGVDCKKELNLMIAHLDYCAKNLLLAYSGMRDAEMVALNYNCLKTVKRKDGKILRLMGNTTKLVGARKEVMWVTSEHSKPAINYLQSIARVCFNNMKARGYDRKRIKRVTDMPLFVKFTHTTPMRDFNSNLNFRKISFRRSDFYSRIPQNRLKEITLKHSDLAELKRFDPLRDWESEGFKTGEPWHLNSHQFRRSLAVYSAQSGLITLPSLKAQFKMTYYYRNNALEAKKIFRIDRGHFASELINTKSEADFYAFIFGTFLSDQKLKGSMGKFYENQKPKKKLDRVKLYESRDTTIKKFQKGELAWAETAIGGCTSTDPCLKKLVRPLVACLNCDQAVIAEEKLVQTIKVQQKFVESLPTDSPSYRAEVEELSLLLKMKRSF